MEYLDRERNQTKSHALSQCLFVNGSCVVESPWQHLPENDMCSSDGHQHTLKGEDTILVQYALKEHSHNLVDQFKDVCGIKRNPAS